MSANASIDLELMRASQLLDSDPAGAAQRASDILASSPGHLEASLLLATAYRMRGDPTGAMAMLESVAQTQPGSPLIQLELGRAYAAAGRATDARAALQRAVELDAGLTDAWRELASQCFAAGDTRAGDAAYARYSRLSRDSPELTDAIAALANNRLEACEALLRRRLEKAPDDVRALHMLAEIATRREDDAGAERLLRRCLDLAPGYAAARYDLARLLNAQQRSGEVLALVERLLATAPEDIECRSLKAQALRFAGRSDEAVALMEQLLAEHPREYKALLLCGHLLREAGQQARAIDMYRRALDVQGGSGRAYWSLANLKTFRFESRDLAAMQAQLARGTDRGAEHTHLEFALGKALEDEGQFAASFEHYARGNALHRATIGYNAESVTREIQRIRSIYDAHFFEERRGWRNERRDPIFIVGLPRCGSTLLEQILASHSQVEGTRELVEIPALAAELAGQRNPTGSMAYPQSLAALGAPEIEALAARYLSRTQPLRTLDKPRFVDKMLANFAHIGLIQLLFPRAAIVDARRHPLGWGLSCYKQLFVRGHNFSYELSELGRYYRDYAALMEHFDAVLPGRVHRVHYEQLVADPEREVRRLLDYCGLPFEEQCLRFYENPRVVHTISSEQVRRPIYSESVDQWRRYEAWLGPLKEVLNDLVDQYPLPAAAS